MKQWRALCGGKRRTRLILLLTVTLLWVSHFGFGAEPVIRVGIYQNEPKIYLDEQGKPAGIFVDLLNEIARIEGWELDYVPCYWGQCIEGLLAKRIDLMPDVAFSPQRSKTFEFNNIPVIDSWSQVYTRPDASLERFADLQNKHVVLMKGSVQEEKFQELMSGFGYDFTKVSANSFREAFVFVQKGIADATVANVFFGAVNFARYGLKPTPVLINPVSLYFASQKGENRQILAAIDTHLGNWMKSPRSFYYRKLAEYMEKRAVPVPTDRFKWMTGIALVLLLPALGLILILIKKALSKTKELKTINRRLREEESQFRSYIESSPYAVFVVDENGNYIDVNPAAETLTEYSRNELLEKNLLDLISPKARQAAESHFSKVLAEGKATGIFPFVKKGGEQRHWSVNAVKISPDSCLAYVSDVTDHFQAEQDLRRIKDHLESEVAGKTRELQKRVSELEHFHDVTIERELRMQELRDEIKRLKKQKT